MKVFGHPIHPMLVHFPTAFFTGSFLLDAVGIIIADTSFWIASFYLQVMGIAFGLLAAIFGAVDYLELVNQEKVFRKATWHGSIQFIVLSIFGVMTGIRFQAFPSIEVPTAMYMVAGGIGVMLMIVGNYLGGDLVFRHGVGVNK